MKKAALAMAGLLVFGAVGYAQTVEVVVPGVTVMTFPHDGVDTDSYELCVGSMDPCLTVATTEAESGVRQFTVPVNPAIPTGTQPYKVVAVGPGGRTEGPVTSFRIQVAPTAPGPLSIVQ